MTDDHGGIHVEELPPGTLAAHGDYVVGNVDGRYFVLSRWCRHQRGDLSQGSIDAQGCLVCPVHGARYDTTTGRAVDGPRMPARAIFKWMMNRRPLERRAIEVQGNDIRVR